MIHCFFYYYYFLVRAIMLMTMTMTNIVCQVEVELEKLWLWEIECWLASNFIGFLLEQFLIWEEGYEFALLFCWRRFATDKIKLGLPSDARFDISIYRGCYSCGNFNVQKNVVKEVSSRCLFIRAYFQIACDTCKYHRLQSTITQF